MHIREVKYGNAAANTRPEVSKVFQHRISKETRLSTQLAVNRSLSVPPTFPLTLLISLPLPLVAIPVLLLHPLALLPLLPRVIL